MAQVNKPHVLLCITLIVALIFAVPLSSVHADHTANEGITPSPPSTGERDYPVTTPYQDSEANGSDWLWKLGAAVIGGVIICSVVGCGGGGGGSAESPSGGSDNQVPEWQQRQNTQEPVQEYSTKPDTSIGCSWGDRAYGTCQ